jgi:O-antigen ligase
MALIAALAATVPLSTWLRRNPNETPRIWMLVGFLPFVLQYFHLYMAAISYGDWPGYLIGVAPHGGGPEWPGYVKGVEISILDVLVLALYLNLPRAQRPLPFRISMGLYFIAVMASTLQAAEPSTALFYSWQIMRMFVIYSVTTRASADPRVVPAILKGMAAAVFVQAGIAIWQRFGMGMFQVEGTLGHQNLLGIMLEFTVFPFFALLLAGRGGRLPLLVMVTSCLVFVLTVSRATVGLAGFGFAIVFVLSALRQWTPRKAIVLLTGAAVAAVFAPLIFLSIEKRGDIHLIESNFERIVLTNEAERVLSDHPLGVGANQYVVVANQGYRQQAEQYRQQIGFGTTGYYTVVHNVYLLVAAETGYPGLISFVLLLICPLIVAFRCGWHNRGDERGDLLLGLGVALLIVYIHGFFEWIFVNFEPEYMFALELGMVAGLAQQLGYWRPPIGSRSIFRSQRALPRSKCR